MFPATTILFDIVASHSYSVGNSIERIKNGGDPSLRSPLRRFVGKHGLWQSDRKKFSNLFILNADCRVAPRNDREGGRRFKTVRGLYNHLRFAVSNALNRIVTAQEYDLYADRQAQRYLIVILSSTLTFPKFKTLEKFGAR
ncbi:MAG TPA: hypothetical protein VK787_11380 [Puia sp.]|jgi:hypothetical protein|nr:hypothetical protein [Puia sp.]